MRITTWKRYFLDQLPHIFTRGNTNKEKAYEEEREDKKDSMTSTTLGHKKCQS